VHAARKTHHDEDAERVERAVLPRTARPRDPRQIKRR